MPTHPALPFLKSAEKGKIVSAVEAVRLIQNGDTVATGGFVGIGFAEEIAIALEELFVSKGDSGGEGKPGCSNSPKLSPLAYRSTSPRV